MLRGQWQVPKVPPPVLTATARGSGCTTSAQQDLDRRTSSLRTSTSSRTDGRCRAADSSAAAAAAPTFGRSPTTALPQESTVLTSRKLYDVVALSNLCVDIVVPVAELPSADVAERRKLLERLTARPPPVGSWEVGGNSNFLIAASRLGLTTASIGHLGDDVYGRFFRDVMAAEGVRVIEPVAPAAAAAACGQTLLCFVLTAPPAQHAFCSSYDFGPWPLLPFAGALPKGAQALLEETSALFINGFVFDELPAAAVVAAARQARAAGAAVFFDPGPRAWTFQEGERRAALGALLDLTDVVLMTAEEAAAVTGEGDAEAAARSVLARPGAATRWCVVKRGGDGALLASRGAGGWAEPGPASLLSQAALSVAVQDTVGCGDSFASAVVLGYTRGHALPAVMALANAVGAATAMGAGAGRNVASSGRVMDLLAGAVPSCADGRHQDAIRVLTASLSSYDGSEHEGNGSG